MAPLINSDTLIEWRINGSGYFVMDSSAIFYAPRLCVAAGWAGPHAKVTYPLILEPVIDHLAFHDAQRPPAQQHKGCAAPDPLLFHKVLRRLSRLGRLPLAVDHPIIFGPSEVE